jgi:hypothetical protein
VAAPALAWAASFFPTFQAIGCAFREILVQHTPHFIRIYTGFVGFSGSTKIAADVGLEQVSNLLRDDDPA